MENKKQSILDVSMQLFLEKGFHQTSVQDIAEACNVSKTTLYKLFATKEELAIGVILYIQEQLIDDMHKIETNQEFTSEDKMKQTILLLLNHHQQKIKFSEYLHFFFTGEQKKQYSPALTRSRYITFIHYANSLQRIYNLPNQSLAWELTLAMHGLIREVSCMENRCSSLATIPPTRQSAIADFILDSLLAIGQQRRTSTPLISREKIAQIETHFAITEPDQAIEPSPLDLLNQLEEQVLRVVAPNEQPDLLRGISLMRVEWEKPEPSKVLLDALWLYLAEKKELTSYLSEFKSTLTL